MWARKLASIKWSPVAAGFLTLVLLFTIGRTCVRYADLPPGGVFVMFFAAPAHVHWVLLNATSHADLKTSSTFSLPEFRGLRRGDSRSKVISRLGAPLVEYSKGRWKVLAYSWPDTDAWWVEVEIWLDEDDRVKKKIHRIRYD